MKQDQALVRFFRETFPPGTRIRLTQMDDPYNPVEPGSLGTVDFIDDQCTLHMLWDNGCTLGLVPGRDRFSVIPLELKSLKLYMRLSIDCYERNEWGDLDDNYVEMDSETAAGYEDEILAAILKERKPEEKERGLMHWYHKEDRVSQKVRSAVFSVENVQGSLWGIVECEMAGDLTPDEMDAFKDYIIGQASDGWGENFEQRPIRLFTGEIYVHLYNSSHNWQVYTEDELQATLSQQKMGGQSM